MASLTRLLPVILMAGLLAGCAEDQATSSPSLGFNGDAGANAALEATPDMTPYPPPGADYYTDRWTDSGNQMDRGQFSNW